MYVFRRRKGNGVTHQTKLGHSEANVDASEIYVPKQTCNEFECSTTELGGEMV